MNIFKFFYQALSVANSQQSKLLLTLKTYVETSKFLENRLAKKKQWSKLLSMEIERFSKSDLICSCIYILVMY